MKSEILKVLLVMNKKAYLKNSINMTKTESASELINMASMLGRQFAGQLDTASQIVNRTNEKWLKT